MGTRPKLLIKFSMPIRLTPKNTVSTVFDHSSIFGSIKFSQGKLPGMSPVSFV